MKRPMVILEMGDGLLKMAWSPKQALELGKVMLKAGERADKLKENVWVGLTARKTDAEPVEQGEKIDGV